MKTDVPKQPVLDALVAEWTTIDDLVTPLTDEQWNAPSGLPGWTVADVVAHIAGTENMLDGREVEATRDVAALAHVNNAIGELNERWLDYYRARTRDELMVDYRAVTAKRAADLVAMSDAEWAADAMTPAGPDSYGRFMRIRDYDCWVHEMDLRDALGIGVPTDPAPALFALQEMAVVLPYIVGKKAAVPKGSTVTFDFVGLAPLRVDVAVADRATVVDGHDGPADVTLTLDVIDFARLAGARPKADPSSVRITGDAALGEKIVAGMHYMI